MATQSLYRRYRPRRFSELKGQDHVVRALRTAVAEGREGQAYLFSGPRGTGKTTSARILAKVLNCSDVRDGEPCCECDSCLAVELGTSYDVHELDAASNNGVEAMRDLIEKASLGTPGRHKVYILDEVHMLSKPAEAALLKTLEEPPPHVVFVLATTDPQKMSDTIISRTQHLRFHLLPADTLHDHVMWVASDAGLTLSDAAIEQVLSEGAGSARDTLSALELVATTGGDPADIVALDEFVEAMIDHDPGRALTMAAQAIRVGRDPRTLTEQLIGFLRNGFLSLMAPDLIQLPSQRLEALTEQARRLGPAGLVRGIEHLGAALTELRHAPDPRVLLDVAIVQLTSEQVATDQSAILDRLQRLERRVAEGVAGPGVSSEAPTGPSPVGRRTSGGESGSVATSTESSTETRSTSQTSTSTRSSSPSASQAAAPSPSAAPSPPGAPGGRATVGGRARQPAPVETVTPASDGADRPVGSAVGVAPSADFADSAGGTDGNGGGPSGGGAGSGGGASTDTASPGIAATDPTPGGAADSEGVAASEPAISPPSVSNGLIDETAWEQVRSGLRGMARAVYAPAVYVGAARGSVTLALPNETHRAKCEEHRAAVEKALTGHLGSAVVVELVIEGGGGSQSSPPVVPSLSVVDGSGDQTAAPTSAPTTASTSDEAPRSTPPSGGAGSEATSVSLAASGGPTPSNGSLGRAIAEQARQSGPTPDPDEVSVIDLGALPDDVDVDIDDLTDAPPEAFRSPIDRLAEAFPGSELVDDLY